MRASIKGPFGVAKVVGSGLFAANDPAAHASEPHFIVGGLRYSRAAMLAENWADEDFCQWLRVARPGEVWDQMHSEHCECVPAEGFTEDQLLAADVALTANKAERYHRTNDRRALELQMQRPSELDRATWMRT